MAVTLTLGGVVFQGFEIPESINFGGQQMLAVHKLPGGTRVVDAMGPDDADIRWSGRFRGPSAEQRATLLDYMRRQGNQILLSWGLHRFQVVIREFTANYQRDTEITYSIACMVVLDEAQALLSLAAGFAEAIAADAVSALGLSDVIGDATIKTAVTAVGSAFSNYQAGVPNTTNAIAGVTAVAEGPLLAGLKSAIGGAQTAVTGAIQATTVNTAPVGAGGSPSLMAGALSNAASGFGKLGNLYQLSGVLGRMATNVANKGK